MTWTETHERTRIVLEVERAALAHPTGELPWRDEYAPWFADRHQLVAFLRARWLRHLICQTDGLDEEAAARVAARLERTHAPILLILARYDARHTSTGSVPVPSPRAEADTVVGAAVPA